jgi:PHP family Zn ribbon phosphoesterase
MIPCKTCGKKGWIYNARGAGVRCPTCGGMRYIDAIGDRLEKMKQAEKDELEYLKSKDGK